MHALLSENINISVACNLFMTRSSSGNMHLLHGKGVTPAVFVLTIGYLETQELLVAGRAFSGTTGSTLKKPIRGLSYSNVDVFITQPINAINIVIMQLLTLIYHYNILVDVTPFHFFCKPCYHSHMLHPSYP
jgi:hypothetical protein